MNHMKKLKTKDNRLTCYALACGYFEQATSKTKLLTLLMEGSVIRIDLYDFETEHRTSIHVKNMRIARNQFAYQVYMWNLKRIPNLAL